MATDDELIKEYGRVSAELKLHEDGVEKAKEARKEIARQLFERHGKGHVYDLGDGVAMIIVASKAQTYFFTPKEKWKKGGRKKKATGKVIEASAKLTAKGGVQNVPLPEGARAKSEPPPSLPPAEAKEPKQTLAESLGVPEPTERYQPPQYDGPNIPAASPELTVRTEQTPKQPKQAPAEAPPKPAVKLTPEPTGDADMDALAKALAELE